MTIREEAEGATVGDLTDSERETLAARLFLADPTHPHGGPWASMPDEFKEPYRAQAQSAQDFFRGRDLADLYGRVRAIVTLAVDAAYGTDDRHGLLAKHVAEAVVTGAPLPMSLGRHFGQMGANVEDRPAAR